MIERPHRRFSLKGACELVLRHKKKIVIFPLAALIVGGLVLLYCPRWYRSEARLFLRVGRETVALDPTASTGQTIAMQQNDRKDEIKSAVELIKSRGVVSQVVDELGADVVLGWQLRAKSGGAASQLADAVVKSIRDCVNSIDPISDREEAIILVERHLSVGAERESTLVVVQYDARSPQLAQTVCNKIVQVYQQAHMRIHRNEESQPFFTQQQEMLRKQLDSSLEALRTAKDEMGLASIADRRARSKSNSATSNWRGSIRNSSSQLRRRASRTWRDNSGNCPIGWCLRSAAFPTRAPICSASNSIRCR